MTGWNDHTRQASWMPVRKRVNGSRQQKTPDNEYPAHNLQEIGLSSVRGSHRMRLVWDGSGLGGREGRTRASFAIPRRRRHAGELPNACCLGRERARRPRGKDKSSAIPRTASKGELPNACWARERAADVPRSRFAAPRMPREAFRPTSW